MDTPALPLLPSLPSSNIIETCCPTVAFMSEKTNDPPMQTVPLQFIHSPLQFISANHPEGLRNPAALCRIRRHISRRLSRRKNTQREEENFEQKHGDDGLNAARMDSLETPPTLSGTTDSVQPQRRVEPVPQDAAPQYALQMCYQFSDGKEEACATGFAWHISVEQLFLFNYCMLTSVLSWTRR